MVTHEGEIFLVVLMFCLLGTFLIAKGLVSLMADHEEFFSRLPWDSCALIYIIQSTHWSVNCVTQHRAFH